jgi:hypothetical protein
MRLAVAALFVAAPSQQYVYVFEKTPDAFVVRSVRATDDLRYQLQRPEGSPLSVESACYFHPLATPNGVVVTDVAPDDHRHHRGIFLGWVEMRGRKDADFWGWGEKAPKKDRKIVNKSVEKITGNNHAHFRIENEWMAEGEVLVRETLEADLVTDQEVRTLDLTYTLRSDAEVKLSRWAFGGFCLRLRKDGKMRILGPEGEVRLPTPNHMKPETSWPGAAWYGCDIVLPDGKTRIGAAVIDHPKNPSALWYNVPAIGMLNPTIVAPQERAIKPGEPLVLRYEVVVMDGPLSPERMKRLSDDFRQ